MLLVYLVLPVLPVMCSKYVCESIPYYFSLLPTRFHEIHMHFICMLYAFYMHFICSSQKCMHFH